MVMDGDIVIRGGTLVDGSGAPGRPADVAVRDGKIAAIGQRLRERSSSTPRARWSPRDSSTSTPTTTPRSSGTRDLSPSSFHGVTTVVAGNCGFSIAPTRAVGVEILVRTLQHVEDMSFDTLMAGVPWDEFESFPEYLDAVERRGVALNYGCYVGHTAVRLFVMGPEAYERAATDDEIATMRAVVGEALDAGAIGFASSWSPTHNGDHGRPVPSRVADLDELTALLEPLRNRSRGVAALLPGGVFSNDQLFDLQRHIGRPFTWTALLTFAGSDYHEQVMAEHVAARAAGADVWPQVSCRPLVFQMNLAEPFSLNTFPNFAALMDAPIEERKAAYRDPAWRAATQAQLDSGGFSLFNSASLSVAESRHPARSRRLPGRRPGGGAGPDAARCPARSLAGRRSHLPVLVGVGQQQSGRDRRAATEGRRPVGAGRLRGPRHPAVRRLFRHRPAGDLGPGTPGDEPRARHPQAHGRAGPCLRARGPRLGAGRIGRRPGRLRS